LLTVPVALSRFSQVQVQEQEQQQQQGMMPFSSPPDPGAVRRLHGPPLGGPPPGREPPAGRPSFGYDTPTTDDIIPQRLLEEWTKKTGKQLKATPKKKIDRQRRMTVTPPPPKRAPPKPPAAEV